MFDFSDIKCFLKAPDFRDMNSWIKVRQFFDEWHSSFNKESVGKKYEGKYCNGLMVEYGRRSGYKKNFVSFIEVFDWEESIATLYKRVKISGEFVSENEGVLIEDMYLRPSNTSKNPYNIYLGKAIYLGEKVDEDQIFQVWYLVDFDLFKKMFWDEYAGERLINLNSLYVVYGIGYNRAQRYSSCSALVRVSKIKASESYAMGVCISYFKKLGAKIKDVHKVRNLGWDIEATFKGVTFCIEIKGTAAKNFDLKELRPSQVRASRENANWMLVTVTELKLQRIKGLYIGVSGEMSVFRRVNKGRMVRIKHPSLLVNDFAKEMG